ncbi:MAG: substrate-binding domain-containing protein [Kiritimatiellae bacterium]|nr:substrate-binding domain-containing protein [Kiritimatiellia bacterium]
MDTILAFSTSIGRAHADMLAGVREFAKGTDWNIQSFVYDGEPFPLRKLLDFWTPAGCIVEGCGNGVPAGIIDHKAFRRTPVVYVGSEPTMTPKDAACVVHDAESVANAAARELMSIGMESFVFIGAKGKGWSNRRKSAFAEAMKLNGHPVAAMDIHPTSAGVYDKDATSLRKWLLELPKPCGVMAADDEIAATAISICRLSGIDVPNDIAIVGVDDNESLCESTVPTLSSVRPDFQQGGRFAARLLARMMRGGLRIQHEAVFGVAGITRRGSTRVFKRRDAEVSAALERIWAPDGVSLSPKDVLAGFSCSRRNAEIRFRQATGKSFLEEIVAARMARAKALLSETVLPIPEIALQCGYRYAANFRDAFRAATGLNPLAWRERSVKNA